ncbi:MAG: hypothetical protein O3C07_04930, partial [Bacteroidetes bacterium]|nr:hypothetical protein [Bacteroidota bacterium]
MDWSLNSSWQLNSPVHWLYDGRSEMDHWALLMPSVVSSDIYEAAGMGVALVRSPSITSVTEPTTIGLLALGLFG